MSDPFSVPEVSVPPSPPSAPTSAPTASPAKAKKPGGQPAVKMSKVVSRSVVQAGTNGNSVAIELDSSEDAHFEENLAGLLNQVLKIAHHDRGMSMALFQVHLERGEELDNLAFTMPVAQIISDNTNATLKSMELAMKAGDRLHKVAELIISAKKSEETNLIQILKLELKQEGGEWNDLDQLPDSADDFGDGDLKEIVAPASVES